MLGVLEGVAAAAPGGDPEMLRRARRELGPEAVFGPRFWTADGACTWDAGGAAGSDDEGAGGHGHGHGHTEVAVRHVARMHPLVRKWRGLVDEEARRWGIDCDVLANGVGSSRPAEGVGGAGQETTSRPLEW